MGTFNITSSLTNNRYTYRNETVIVIGSYNTEGQNATLKNVSGIFYHVSQDGEQGDEFGDFNGNMRNGEMMYSMSEMSRRNRNSAWDAIDEIEEKITGANEEG